jgi:hypothetical protein
MTPAPIGPAIDLLQRIQCEFLEMPGLRLTERQARRLWNLDSLACANILRVLVDGGFLFRTPDGSFMHVEQARPLRADAMKAGVPRGVRSKIPAA